VTDTGTTSAYLFTIPSQTVSLTSFDVHYLAMGEGYPLILVHGGGMWLYSFRHNVGELSRSFRVYALDMPGYGYTEPRGKPVKVCLDTMADTLLEFMDTLRIPAAVVVGHSWGGGWALRFASLHPARVGGLVLIDSSGLAVRDVLEWELLKVPIAGPLLLRCLTLSTVTSRLVRSYHKPGMVTPGMALEVYLPMKLAHNRRAQIELSRNQDWKLTEQALARITHPALLIWGERDRYLDVSLLRRFQSRMPHARSCVFEECGHSPHEEYPEKANRLIASFVMDHVPGAAREASGFFHADHQ
jgi:pimeloyl-ACP methyl ester carboxylesterase